MNIIMAGSEALNKDEVLRILYIEDDSSDLKLLENTLKKAFSSQFLLINVTCIKDTKRVLYQTTFDIVLLDLTLPDSIGIDSVSRLRESVPNIAIVVLTGTEDEELGIRAIQCGAQDYITKGNYDINYIKKVIYYAMERHRCDEEMLCLAQYDPLTSLANRPRFLEHLQAAIARVERNCNYIALFFIDLDNFKTINDTLGHDIGDLLLQSIAKRFQAATRATDFLARLGGDEFTLLVEYDYPDQEPIIVAEKIIAALKEPIRLPNGENVHASCSIGVATHYGKKNDIDHLELMRCADAAMYQAKRSGRNNYKLYDSKLARENNNRIHLIKGLNNALVNSEFTLYYQPIYHANQTNFAGAEALIRWYNSNGERFMPVQFIPLLEENNLIDEVGSWVLTTACRQFYRWLQQGIVEKTHWISVNVSSKQFFYGNFSTKVAHALDESGIPAGCLHLELTESVFMHDLCCLQRELNNIQRMGVHVSIDDFGTGFSSMQYLAVFPFDTIKIDRSFIASYLSSSDGRIITHSIIQLANNLGKKVIAEGIESKLQAEALTDEGSGYLQGYYFSKPEPADRFVLNLGCTSL